MGLLRYLFEREYGVHLRADEKQRRATEARLAARYERAKRSIPIDPDYIPE